MIDVAVQLARRSPHRRFRTGAALYRKDKLIASGWAHTPAGRYLLFSRHAEAHALMRAHESLDGGVCFIATLTRHGNLANGKPCLDCVKKLRDAGVVLVCYTTANGVQQLDLTRPLDEAAYKSYRSRAKWAMTSR